MGDCGVPHIWLELKNILDKLDLRPDLVYDIEIKAQYRGVKAGEVIIRHYIVDADDRIILTPDGNGPVTQEKYYPVDILKPK